MVLISPISLTTGHPHTQEWAHEPTLADVTYPLVTDPRINVNMTQMVGNEVGGRPSEFT